MKKCVNCSWQGEDSEVVGPLIHCPVCGDNTLSVEVEKSVEKSESEDNILDLDGDGDFDEDDKSIAGKVLGTKIKKKGKKGKR